MNIRQHLQLAGSALLAILDPEQEWLPTGGWEVAHDMGRWWDAILRLEEAIGFVIPAELEAASLRNLARLTDNPDRLLMNNPRIPWLSDRAVINPHNFREALLTYGGLVRRRRNLWARQAGLQLVRSMARCLQPNGRLDLTRLACWGSVPYTADQSHWEEVQNSWFDGTATSGRCLEALVWFYEATGEPAVLELARQIAGHHLRLSTSPDGSIRPEILSPQNSGHDHSFHGTLRGLLLFGLLTGQKDMIEVVERTYRNGVRGKIVKESGWAPHDLGKTRFPNPYGDPVSDPASTGDSAQLALWLALRASCMDLLDDVERLVRARLLPAQLTPADVERNPGFTPSAREIGAWGIHAPTHAGKGCTPDVLAAVTHSLCDIYTHICTSTPAGLRVNLHLDYEDERVKIESRRGTSACVSVWVKQPGDLFLRIPQWAPESSLRLEIDGKRAEIRHMGTTAWVGRDRLTIGSRVDLMYDLPTRETVEPMPSGRIYRFTWRGDEITAIDPQDGPLPFYPSNPALP